jgi:hypothetical protein
VFTGSAHPWWVDDAASAGSDGHQEKVDGRKLRFKKRWIFIYHPWSRAEKVMQPGLDQSSTFYDILSIYIYQSEAELSPSDVGEGGSSTSIKMY